MPKGYIIAEVTVTSPGQEFDEYRGKILDTVEAFDGQVLVRGGNPKLLEGDHPVGGAVILEFSSFERAMEWYNSAEYQKILPLRLKNAATRALCAAGT